ncbi:zinc finger protein 862-like [Melanaphis sacchari]|uniref:zinc finger protein 862-like n=1 Tax=Melanaphis sacchari TaxID=742174 RepID=UPI000DC12CF0|nr:zinc finger protein 862-like [Melanaphis sacchari]
MSDISSSEEGKFMKNQTKAPKRKFTHRFRSDWLNDDDLKPWLMKSIKGDTYFNCKFCKIDLMGGISAVKKHGKSDKHVQLIRSRKNTMEINKMTTVQNASKLVKKTKEAEIRLSMFIVEHNIAIRTVDHLVSLIKIIGEDSDVIKNLKCNRTKATSVVCNVIGECGMQNLIQRMKNQMFSIMIDESTDKSSVKHLAIVTRIVDTDSYEVRDEFAGLIKVNNATAQSIFETVINFFKSYDIPYKSNLVGFASDGANVMFGEHHSVKTLLENEVPSIFVIKCLCHSLALCASYACKKIPIEVEELMREIYTYMKYSYKRQTHFEEFQSFVEVKPHKLLQPSQTRWLSLYVCVKRVLEQWNALKLYFQGAHQFYKRFPFNSSYIKSLKALSFLNPNNISNIVSIAPAATHFELILNMDLNDLDREWRLLKNSVEDYNNETIAFWKTVKDMKKGDDSELFPLLNKFIKFILTLPHSSAATERVFSTINLNKTKTRNRLETETLSGIMLMNWIVKLVAMLHC